MDIEATERELDRDIAGYSPNEAIEKIMKAERSAEAREEFYSRFRKG